MDNIEAVNINETTEISENQLVAIRKDKLQKLKDDNQNPYEVTSYDVDAHSKEIIDNFVDDAEEPRNVSIAGRITSWRDMGKANFIDIYDRSGRMQVYVRIDDVGEEAYKQFKKWDIGDIVEIKGFVFKTRREEISVHAKAVKLLSKSLLPLPE